MTAPDRPLALRDRIGGGKLPARWAGWRRADVLAAGLALAIAFPACNQRNDNPIKPEVVTTPLVVSIAITSSSVSNVMLQLTAVANFTDGSTRNVTREAVWRSSNLAVATVSATGLVTAIGTGRADITATFENIAGSFSVTVQL